MMKGCLKRIKYLIVDSSRPRAAKRRWLSEAMNVGRMDYHAKLQHSTSCSRIIILLYKLYYTDIYKSVLLNPLKFKYLIIRYLIYDYCFFYILRQPLFVA